MGERTGLYPTKADGALTAQAPPTCEADGGCDQQPVYPHRSTGRRVRWREHHYWRACPNQMPWCVGMSVDSTKTECSKYQGAVQVGGAGRTVPYRAEGEVPGHIALRQTQTACSQPCERQGHQLPRTRQRRQSQVRQRAKAGKQWQLLPATRVLKRL